MAHKEKDMFYVQQLHHCEPDHILKGHELTITFYTYLNMDFDWFARLKERKQRDGWRVGDISVEHNLTFSSSVLDKFISRILRGRIYAHKSRIL